MVKTQISAISLLFMAFMLACSGSAKISQGNDGSAGVYRPNDLTSASAQISASSGGYINVGKAQLRIPAQALESDTTITAEVADIQLPAGGAKAIGKGIRLKPEGLQFLKPAELMLCYSATEAAALQAQGAQVYYHTDDNQYVAIAGTVDTATNCVSSHIEHFSSYVAAAYLQLPGNTAPNIGGANFLPTTPLAGVPLRVRTAINDTNGSTPIGTTVPGTVVTAFLYYRTVGSPTFTKVALQSDTTDDTVTNRYYYLIPGNEVTTAGIEYYFEATDNLNVMRRLPAAAGSFSTRTVPTAATGIRFAPVAANSKLEISAGFNRALTLQATDNGTTWQNISADNFALTNASLGSAVRSGPSTIRFSAIGAGASQLTSTIGALSTAIDITVVPGLLTHIEITDMNQVALTGTLQLPISQAYDLDVVGYDAYGNLAQVYPVFTATGGVGSVTIDAAGAHLLTGAAVASGSVIADIAGLTDSISVSLYVPPQVTATAPFDNTTGIALNSSIGVSFSHIMDTSTLTTTTTSACVGSLQVSSDNFTTCVPMASATPSFFASDTLAVIQPAASLSGTTTYKIRVTTGARNTSGYPLSAIYTTPTGFTTAAAPVALAWYTNDSTVNMVYHHMCEDVTTGNLYLIGSFDAAGNTNWFLKTSNATGATWTPTPAGIFLTQTQIDVFPKIACDSAGNIYVMGMVNDATLGNKSWKVFKTADQGATFVEIDALAGNNAHHPFDIVVNAANEVFIIGGKRNGIDNDLYIRKSGPLGVGWSDLYQQTFPGFSANTAGAAIDSAGNLYVAAGLRNSSTSATNLVVQKFDGSIWSTMDNYQPPIGYGLKNNRIPVHIFGGNIYVGGASRDLSTNMGIWFIRTCNLAACSSWSDLDYYSFENKTPDYDIADFYLDQLGNFWSNGLSFNLASSIYFIARKKPAAGIWADALAEYGNFKYATYLRTSANRFFSVGMEFNGGFRGVVLEYR